MFLSDEEQDKNLSFTFGAIFPNPNALGTNELFIIIENRNFK